MFQLSTLEKKIFQKKFDLGSSLYNYIGQESFNRWHFTVPIFSKGFDRKDIKKTFFPRRIAYWVSGEAIEIERCFWQLTYLVFSPSKAWK